MLIPSDYVENEKSRILCLKGYSNLKPGSLFRLGWYGWQKVVGVRCLALVFLSKFDIVSYALISLPGSLPDI